MVLRVLRIDVPDLPAYELEAFQTEGPSLVVIPIDYRENQKLTERLGNIGCSI